MVKITENSALNSILNATSSERVLKRGDDGEIKGTSKNGGIAWIKSKFGIGKNEYTRIKTAFANAVIKELGLDRPAYKSVRGRLETELKSKAPLTIAKAQEIFKVLVFNATHTANVSGLGRQSDTYGNNRVDLSDTSPEKLASDVAQMQEAKLNNAASLLLQDISNDKAGELTEFKKLQDTAQLLLDAVGFNPDDEDGLEKLKGDAFASKIRQYSNGKSTEELQRLKDFFGSVLDNCIFGEEERLGFQAIGDVFAGLLAEAEQTAHDGAVYKELGNLAQLVVKGGDFSGNTEKLKSITTQMMDKMGIKALNDVQSLDEGNLKAVIQKFAEGRNSSDLTRMSEFFTYAYNGHVDVSGVAEAGCKELATVFSKLAVKVKENEELKAVEKEKADFTRNFTALLLGVNQNLGVAGEVLNNPAVMKKIADKLMSDLKIHGEKEGATLHRQEVFVGINKFADEKKPAEIENMRKFFEAAADATSNDTHRNSFEILAKAFSQMIGLDPYKK